MNHKITLLLLSACLSLQACTKKEAAAQDKETIKPSSALPAQDQLKLDTIKKMYSELSETEHGNEVLDRYATETFKSILNMSTQFPGEMCGLDHNVLLQGQDEDYKQQVQFQLNEQKQVIAHLASGNHVTFELECDANQCQISDVLEAGHSLSQGVEQECTELEQYHQNEQAALNATPEYKMSYRIEYKTLEIGNQSYPSNRIVISSESDFPVDISSISVNRGNCPINIIRDQNHVLNFGQTYRIRINCDPQDVKEVNLTLSDGQELTMAPNH
ncbi:hypothetical protein [Acinetobacter guerrae]|uniref:hypothetical protein n=1 Tax=Acinetobacter guerrae TaxID=1843371 RepID=UPI00125F81F8|nr:hypothetical protein [Acinetobacter guerrae]